MYFLLHGEHPLFEITDTIDAYFEKLKKPKWRWSNHLTDMS